MPEGGRWSLNQLMPRRHIHRGDPVNGAKSLQVEAVLVAIDLCRALNNDADLGPGRRISHWDRSEEAHRQQGIVLIGLSNVRRVKERGAEQLRLPA